MPNLNLFGDGNGPSQPSAPKPTKVAKVAQIKKPAFPSTFTSNWSARTTALKKAGYKPQHIQAVYSYDYKNVKQGKKPLTNEQAYLAAHALETQTMIVKPKNSGGGGDGILGFIGNVASDVGSIVSAIPKMAPAIGKTVQQAIAESPQATTVAAAGEKPGQINKAGMKRIAARAKVVQHDVSKGDYGGAVKAITQSPAVSLFPGAWTVGNAASGDWNTIKEHPLLTAIDVLPAVSKLGEGIAPVVGYEAGSAGEAFAQGNVPKGLFRSAFGTTEVPKSIAGSDLITSGEATRLPRTSEMVRSIAESRGWDKTLREEAYRPIEVARRTVQNYINKSGETYLDIFGKNVTENQQLKNVIEGTTPIEALPEHLKPVLAEFNKIDEKATQDGIASGDLRQIPYEGKFHTYDASHPVVKAYDKLQTAIQKVQNLQHDVVGLAQDETKAPRDPGVVDAKINAAVKNAGKMQAKFVKTFLAKPSRVWYPMIYDQTIPAMKALYEVDFNNGDITASTFEKYVKGLGSGWIAPEYEKAFNAEMDQAAKYWYTDFKNGARPRYIPNVSEDAVKVVAHSSPVPDRVTTPNIYKTASLHSFRPGVSSIAAALTYRDAQIFLSDASKELVKQWGDTFGKSAEDVRALETVQYDKSRGKVGDFSSREAKINSAIKKNWVSFNDEYGIRFGSASNIERETDVLIPRSAVKAINQRLGQFSDPSKAGMVWDKATKTFRIAVTTSPRHVVHVTTAGAMYSLGEQGIEPFLRLRDAYHFIKNGEFESMPGLQSGMRMAAGFSNDDIRGIFDGQVMGETLKAHIPMSGRLSNAMEWFHDFEARIAQTWKSGSYLVERDRLVREGMNEDAATFKAIQEANRIHMDSDAMTPLERQITRTIMPFYSFQRQLLRYMFRYPGDHPLATAMLGTASRMEQKDQATGLPGLFGTFVNIPTAIRPFTDTVMGGPTNAIDIKTLNPFRNFGDGRSPWTLAGFTSSLNPAIRGPLEYVGINTLNANVNQYLGQHVDPASGSLVSNPTQSLWSSMLHAYIPQSGIPIISSLLGSSTYLNQLQAQDPTTYRKTLMSILGIPFAPFDAQENKARIKLQLNYYKVAQQQVSAAVKAGNTSGLGIFDMVPYKGNLYTPAKLDQLLKAGG